MLGLGNELGKLLGALKDLNESLEELKVELGELKEVLRSLLTELKE